MVENALERRMTEIREVKLRMQKIEHKRSSYD